MCAVGGIYCHFEQEVCYMQMYGSCFGATEYQGECHWSWQHHDRRAVLSGQ